MAVDIELDDAPLTALIGGLGGAVSRFLTKIALDIEAGAKRNVLTGARTGRVYKRGGASHQAAAPGEPPATDTGALAGSIASALTSSEEAAITVSADYAAVQELGGAHTPAHPFLMPAANEVAKSAPDEAARMIGELL